MTELENLKSRLGYITYIIGESSDEEKSSIEKQHEKEIVDLVNRIQELEYNG